MQAGHAKYATNPGKKPYIYEPTGIIENGVEIGIARKDIKNYITDDFLANFLMWKRCKNWGLPENKGWLDMPAKLMNAFDVFDLELKEWKIG